MCSHAREGWLKGQAAESRERGTWWPDAKKAVKPKKSRKSEQWVPGSAHLVLSGAVLWQSLWQMKNMCCKVTTPTLRKRGGWAEGQLLCYRNGFFSLCSLRKKFKNGKNTNCASFNKWKGQILMLGMVRYCSRKTESNVWITASQNYNFIYSYY